MTSQEQLIKARLSILAMAAELKNIAKACKFGWYESISVLCYEEGI